MNRRFLPYCPILASFLIAGCWSASTFEPPVAKTNPNPTQRYEITVELVDPPPDIRQISGVAHFGVGTRACLPYQEKIARVTIGTSYKRELALVRVSGNTYKGHIFLDWPIDEDYYGLGVCKWELGYVDTTLTRSNDFLQIARLSAAKLISASEITAYCREKMRDEFDKACLTPSHGARAKELDLTSYLVNVTPSRMD